tara:strand:- start:4188 stop:5423 length:1236 start_codon:yes stop_codon:yes gene_type:complete
MDVKLPPSDAKNLRETFFELLQDFSTFPAAQNFFLVSIDNLPASINDERIKELGMRPFNTKPGIDTNRKVHEKFFGKGGGYMFLATGVDTTTEHNTVTNRGKTINGILPTGPFMESHDYPDNDLDIQFYETNISVIDGIFRPWAQLYGVYGNIDKPVLTANIDIFFLSKQSVTSRKTSFMSMLFGSPGSSSPVVRKIYKYKDCIPYQINDAGVNEYTGEMDTGSISVKWRFSRYEVLTPHVVAAEPPPPTAPKPEPGKYNLAEDRTKGNWDDDIWTAEVPPSPSAKKPDAKSKAEGKFIGPGDVPTPAERERNERKEFQEKWVAGIQQTDVRGKPIAAVGEDEPKYTKFNPVKFKKSRDFSNELPLKDQSPKQQKRAYVQALRDQEARKNPLEDPNDPSFGETRGTKPPGP